MLGVTGPNEYENNVHNNWYTNYIAAWCLRYTGQSLDRFNREKPELFSEFVSKTSLEISEIKKWKEIIDNCYYPRDEKRRIFLQQDGFLDKVYKPVDELSDEHKPINKNWSWDRILRSCYIKQADVLQGMYFFEDEFDVETIRRHFDYYEPITVHESSLSPCVHVILASVIGYREKAYEMYLRTARLDLDDYNADSDEGCHTTSMAGTWMAVVKGFGGMRVQNDVLCFDPYIPSGWEKYRFKIRFRGATIRVSVTDDKVQVENLSDQLINIRIKSKAYSLKGHSSLESVNSQENPVA
jgi:maltose phosphorylase